MKKITMTLSAVLLISEVFGQPQFAAKLLCKLSSSCVEMGVLSRADQKDCVITKQNVDNDADVVSTICEMIEQVEQESGQLSAVWILSGKTDGSAALCKELGKFLPRRIHVVSVDNLNE